MAKYTGNVDGGGGRASRRIQEAKKFGGGWNDSDRCDADANTTNQPKDAGLGRDMQDERNRQARAKKKAENEAQNNRASGEWRNFGDPNRKTKKQLLEEKRKAQSNQVKISEGVTTTTTKGCFPILLMIPAGVFALGYLSIQYLQNLR